jgi:hypothetical protein
MLQLFYPTAVQQAGLLLLCSVFLFLGLNVAVAWGQAKYASTRTPSTTSSSRRTPTHINQKSSTRPLSSKKSTSKPPSTADFTMPDGEYLDAEPSTIRR